MDSRQLRYFVRIVECGSLSQAARQLFVAQSALSQQLAKLEDQVGKSLLDRSSKGVTPTTNGLALYNHAKFTLRQFDQALSVARSETSAVQGMVTVGLPATTVAAIGLKLVQRVRQLYPGILLNVVEGMSGHIGQMMRLGQLDLAVLFNRNISTDLIVEPLLEEELFVITAEQSQLVPTKRNALRIAEVARLPLILPTGSHGLRQRISETFEDHGLITNVVAEIDSLSLLMNCVYEDMGATIKPIGAVMNEGARGRKWRYFSVTDAPLRRRNYLVSQPPERLTTAISAVATELKKIKQELIQNNDWPGFQEIMDAPQMAETRAG